MDFFRNKCKEHNLRITPQRVVIYKELSRSKDHPSADMVFKKARETFPNISFDTVNRTVLTFSKIGIIDVVEGYGDLKRFDADINSHHHFRCLKCNNIIDIYNKYYDDIKIPRDVKKRLTVLKQKVCLEGICNKCR
jgi:Fur family peroxide stress response transcriptional regulator